jgi:hypothetical protein
LKSSGALEFALDADGMQVMVECFLGHHDEEEPYAFFLGNRQVVVDRIIDRWPSQRYCYFKAEAEGGDIYILRNEKLSGQWSLILFQSRHQSLL